MSEVKSKDSMQLVKTGNRFPVTGYYAYSKHVDEKHTPCYVTPQSSAGILFKKGGIVPKLGSCPHDIYWKLEFRY